MAKLRHKFPDFLETHKIGTCPLNYLWKQLNKMVNQRPSTNISQSLYISKLYNKLKIQKWSPECKQSRICLLCTGSIKYLTSKEKRIPRTALSEAKTSTDINMA